VRWLAALAALTLLAGCGKHKITKADVIAQGNSICQTAQRDVRALAPPSANSLKALAPYLVKASKIVNGQAAKVKDLPEPNEDVAVLRQFKTAAAQDAQRYTAMSQAATAGDRAAYAKASASLQTSQTVALANRYGLTGCAGTSTAG
jgi:hypothetical protein